MAALNQHFKLNILLRDENVELTDQYLTDGKSRSIPKLIACNEAREELFTWGAKARVPAETLPSNEK